MNLFFFFSTAPDRKPEHDERWLVMAAHCRTARGGGDRDVNKFPVYNVLQCGVHIITCSTLYIIAVWPDDPQTDGAAAAAENDFNEERRRKNSVRVNPVARRRIIVTCRKYLYTRRVYTCTSCPRCY